MSVLRVILYITIAVIAVGAAATITPEKCRCGPDTCWPLDVTWNLLNKTVDGRLIHTQPIAQSCYPGDSFNLSQCAFIDSVWSNERFQSTQPLGLALPRNITCYPVNYTAGEVPSDFGPCIIGNNPRYVVNATSIIHISNTLKFAKERNVRLVIKGTGHDLLGRSDGYGSLLLWLRYFRNGITVQPKYQSTNKCTKSNWTGSALLINGSYQWVDVLDIAKANNIIVVTGGTPSVGTTGGWLTGGGHGPATRNYGLGADQLLEAKVMLQDGRIVTASACENSDLYRAMRGGGPGYGITLSTTVKAYPNVKTIAVQHLSIAPRTINNYSAVLDAVAIMLQSYPDLSDAGYAGYPSWSLSSPTPVVNDSFTGYTHGVWAIGKTEADMRAAFNVTRHRLQALDSILLFSETYVTYTDYWTFYHTESGLHNPVGVTPALTSRLINKRAVADYQKVRAAVEMFSGAPEEYTSNTILLVSGGQVFKDAADPYSGLNPAWRKSHFVSVIGRGWAAGTSNVAAQAIRDDITFGKGGAQKTFAPDTGAYMNEGNRDDPDYIQNFYGTIYKTHLATKQKYDPANIFFCPTCVGSKGWVERPDGPLCFIPK